MSKNPTDAISAILDLLPSEWERNVFQARSENPAFRDFLVSNAAKILKRLRGQKTDEDKLDVLAELEIAHRLLAVGNYNLEYEPFPAFDGGPDFRLTGGDVGEAFVEVRRFRLSDKSAKIANFKSSIIERLKYAEPSICYTIDLQSKTDAEAALANELADMAIVQRCVERIHEAVQQGIGAGKVVTVELNNGRIAFELLPSGGRDPEHRNGYITGSEPIPFTQFESKSVRDAIINKLHQFPAGKLNVLVVVSHSDTIDDREFPFVFGTLVEGCHEDSDLRAKFRNLGAIAWHSKWAPVGAPGGRFKVWRNPLAVMELDPTRSLHENLSAM